MKKIFILFLLAGLLPYWAISQTLTPSVIASSGGFATASNGSLSFTVGEMTMVQTFSSANNFLTQGFQQPEDLFVSIPEIPNVSGGLIIFPSPTSGAFSLQFTGDEETEKVVSMYNSLGQLVKKVAVHQAFGTNKIDLDISEFSQGIYLIQLDLRNSTGALVPVVSKINLLK